MNQRPNLETMTRQELRKYVILHPNDTEAFHKLADIIAETPGTLCVTDEDLRAAIEKKINQ
jgi:hypothetical protein